MAHEDLKKTCNNCKHRKVPGARHPCSWCQAAGDKRYFWELWFQPEYFSGLNWRDAEKFIKKHLYYSNDGEMWTESTSRLQRVCKPSKGNSYSPFRSLSGYKWNFARTCPETYAHPSIKITVNDKEYELPKPEMIAPSLGTAFFVPWPDGSIFKRTWQGMFVDERLLENNVVHLTEDRAKAYVDFWKGIHS